MQIIQLVFLAVIGLLIARIFSLQGLEQQQWYALLVTGLLAIGLYASTYGIVLHEARRHLRIILSAVTFGVVLKAALIGGSLWFVFDDPVFLLFGVMVAQIDPLSVAGLMSGERMSPKAKTILASWASFDDPITVILSLYAPIVAGAIAGVDMPSLIDGQNMPLVTYGKELLYNLALAAGVLGIWLLARRGAARSYPVILGGLVVIECVLLATSLSLATVFSMMLGIALIGLFLRPRIISGIIDQAIPWALRIAALLLGFLLLEGIQLWKGIALGAASYVAQIIVGWLLTYGLPGNDRWHIALAQQNGITAIILSLLFEPVYPGTVAIVAPAILVINSLHFVCNGLRDRWVRVRQFAG